MPAVETPFSAAGEDHAASETKTASDEPPPARPRKAFDLSGKDYFTREEAAHYCCVSLSQFKRQAQFYGLWPIPFMGKPVYRRADCQRAIEREWRRFESLASPTSSTGTMPPGFNGATLSERLAATRRKRRKLFR